MNQRLRRMGRHAGRVGWCQPPSDVAAPGERGSIHYESPSLMEPPPDTTWVEFEPINQPRKGRHRRQR